MWLAIQTVTRTCVEGRVIYILVDSFWEGVLFQYHICMSCFTGRIITQTCLFLKDKIDQCKNQLLICIFQWSMYCCISLPLNIFLYFDTVKMHRQNIQLCATLTFQKKRHFKQVLTLWCWINALISLLVRHRYVHFHVLDMSSSLIYIGVSKCYFNTCLSYIYHKTIHFNPVFHPGQVNVLFFFFVEWLLCVHSLISSKVNRDWKALKKH